MDEILKRNKGPGTSKKDEHCCLTCRHHRGGESGQCSVYIYENGWHIRNEPKDNDLSKGCDLWEEK